MKIACPPIKDTKDGTRVTECVFLTTGRNSAMTMCCRNKEIRMKIENSQEEILLSEEKFIGR